MTSTPATADNDRSARPGYRATLRELAGAQKKAAPGSPPYSIYVNRKAGRYIAAVAHGLDLTPNLVSVISAIFTLSGIVLIATAAPRWWLGPLVWASLAVGYAFDSADGQVARLRGGGTAAGEWLDHVLDSLKISSLHLAVLVTTYRHFHLASASWLLVPIGYTVVAAVSFFAMILNDQLKTIHALRAGVPVRSKAAAQRTWLKTLFLVPTDYGVLCLIFLLLGTPKVFFVLYTALFFANAGHLMLASTKWFRDMRRLDPK